MEEARSKWMGAQGEDRDGNEYECAERGDYQKSTLRLNSRRNGGRRRDLRDRRRGRLDWSIRNWNMRRLGRLSNFWLNLGNGCDEPVTRAGDCLHIDREVRTVAQNLADFPDGGVDSVFDVDEDFLFPQAPGDFFAVHDLAMFSDQKDEEFEGFSLELEPATVAGELKFAAMKAEVAESIDGKGHRFPPEGG
jgi:hypothetical protein